MNRYITMAQDLAKTHDYKSGRHVSALAPKGVVSKHCAIVVSGGRVLSVGFNSLHDRYIRFDPAMAAKARRFQSGNHAEIDALFGLRKFSGKSVKLYVVRVLANGSLANSQPCALCRAAIASMTKPHVSMVRYSVSPAEYSTWYPSDETAAITGVAA